MRDVENRMVKLVYEHIVEPFLADSTLSFSLDVSLFLSLSSLPLSPSLPPSCSFPSPLTENPTSRSVAIFGHGLAIRTFFRFAVGGKEESVWLHHLGHLLPSIFVTLPPLFTFPSIFPLVSPIRQYRTRGARVCPEIFFVEADSLQSIFFVNFRVLVGFLLFLFFVSSTHLFIDNSDVLIVIVMVARLCL